MRMEHLGGVKNASRFSSGEAAPFSGFEYSGLSARLVSSLFLAFVYPIRRPFSQSFDRTGPMRTYAQANFVLTEF
jgi:hypothetical protein